MESSSYLAASPQPGRKGCFPRYKWLIIVSTFLVVAAGVICGVLFGYVFPNNAAAAASNNQLKSDKVDDEGTKIQSDDQEKEKDEDDKVDINDFTKPDLTKLPKFLGTIKDYKNNLANSYSVKLGEPFPYDTKKIRGVNLGGWLVPEPFIVPSLFTKPVDNDKSVIDEWTLCTKLGKKKCQEVLSKHYDTFVTEKEIKLIADSGLNHVRIPFGYWSIDNFEDEPFVYGAWNYLLRGIGWCRKYGIRVMIDFHAAPGSQNGWNHSGRSGEIHFLNGNSNDSEKNVERFIKILEQVTRFFNREEFRDIVTQIGVLNEPNLTETKQAELLEKFNLDSYKRIRSANANITNSNNPILFYHDGFRGLSTWTSSFPKSTYKNVGLDGHNYLAFQYDVYSLDYSKFASIACDGYYKLYGSVKSNFGMVIAGEFSGAFNDCGIYLNGMTFGARYEGKMDGKAKVCDTCTCDTFIKYKEFTDKYKTGLRNFIEAQMDAFEQGTGWYYWNFKIEGNVNPSWDYLLGVKEGWIPKDAGKRSHKCGS